jgi:gas vesicle protein
MIGREYNRKDLIFQRKLKYFEGVIETIEKNKKMYYNLISKAELSKKKSHINDIIEELKKERKKFFIMASPLYLNTKIFSEKIVHFVRIEKDIFNKISQLKETNKEGKEQIIEQLKNNLKNLNKKSEEILYEMKKKLVR